MENKTRIIAVTSGKGGVGKSNFSVNLAIAYSKIGKKVIVMDADLGLANINVLLGISPAINLSHVINKQKTLKEVVQSTKYGIDIIAGASGFYSLVNLTSARKKNLIKQFLDLGDIDVFIIDTGAGVSDNVLAFLEAVDDIIIVTTPEPTAITDAYGLIKIISRQLDLKKDSIKLVINKIENSLEGKNTFNKIFAIAEKFLETKISYLGFIYKEDTVGKSVIKQIPFIVNYPRSKVSMCINHILDRLEKNEYKEGNTFGNFITKLFKRK